MIDDERAIELVHSACKGIEPYWQEHLDFWQGEKPGAYNEIAVFAHYVVDSYGNGHTDDFKAIFENIEAIIVNGTESARGLAVVGFLEAVRNVSSHRSFGSSVFERWLGPRSAQAWNELARLWEGKSSLADVIRAQRDKDA